MLTGPGEARVGVAIGNRALRAPMYEAEVVARLVRTALLEAGLGQAERHAPLADIVAPGTTVLLKPNWVVHENQGSGGLDCLYTNPEFVAAALREVLAARPRRVIIGDAPIQMGVWSRLVPTAFLVRLQQLCADASVQLEVMDFRRTTLSRSAMSAILSTEVRAASRYVRFDLGLDSLLEPISEPGGRFRVSDYDPDALMQTHHPGTHQYLLCREAFEADVVLSLPKLKTHAKAGITGALKNLVGLNGNKDFLPHHRFGGTDAGGDCYPGRAPMKEVAARLEDAANRRLGRSAYTAWRSAGRVARLVAGGAGGRMDGSWYGNDTVWRMALDLNRILVYGKVDGRMAETPQRTVYSLSDCIVCGQGDGPLKPDPLAVNAVTFARSPVAADIVHSALLRLDWTRVPLLREAGAEFRWPLAPRGLEPFASVGGEPLSPAVLAEVHGVAAEPPRGWKGFIELPITGTKAAKS